MKAVRLTFLVLLLIAFVVPAKQSASGPESARQAGWRTREFVVKWYSPGLSDQIYDLGSQVFSGMSDEERNRISQWDLYIRQSLREISAFYEANGLIEPLLETEEDDNGNLRFVVHAYDFASGFIITEGEKNAAGYYSDGTCSLYGVLLPRTVDLNPSGPKLALNVHKFRSTPFSELSTETVQDFYETISHELFHAIQASYDKQFSSLYMCKVGEETGYWAISEGTATAAGTLATIEKYPDYLFNKEWSDESIGAFLYGDREFLRAYSSYADDDPAIDKTEAYDTSSFWRYLAERFGGVGVFNVMFRERFEISGLLPKLPERYVWLDKALQKISGKNLYILLPEFQSEFGSYEKRYTISNPNLAGSWVKQIYRGGFDCPKVVLNAGNGFYGEVVLGDGGETLYTAFTTCVELTWAGLAPLDGIWIEAVGESASVLDQLHLGVPSVSANDNTDNCYEIITAKVESGEASHRELECGFGKVYPREYSKTLKSKEWLIGSMEKGGEFFAGDLGRSGSATLVVTNIAPDPSKTKPIDQTTNRVTLKISINRTRTANNAQYEAPVFQSIAMPDISPSTLTGMMDRYRFYGFVRESGSLPRSPMIVIGTRAADGSNKSYSISVAARDGVDFGYTGEIFGLVANESGDGSSLCDAKNGVQRRPIGKITKNDEAQLRIELDTDLCRVMPNSEIRVVDTVDAEFVLPFGRRYFASTAPRDLITPGLELYIDEYIKDVLAAGLPVPPGVLYLDGSVPNQRHPNGNDPPTGPDGGPDTSSGNIECECTCDGFRKLQQKVEEAKNDPSKVKELGSIATCVQRCSHQYASCRNR